MRRMLFTVLTLLVAVLLVCAITTPAQAEPPAVDAPVAVSALPVTPEPQEDYENEKIEAALIEKANVIEGCTVTWYAAETCGKQPGDAAYGITYSGLPAVAHLTCAVDPDVIPLYADVFVQYADGTIEQLWATDTGVKGNHIDIYEPDYETCIRNGRQSLTVWWVQPCEMEMK